MPLVTGFLFLASMDVDPKHEAIFNEVYDNEHIPALLGVSGIISATRFERSTFSMLIGGERRAVSNETEPKYTVVYELERPDVLLTDGWSTAIERGRWPREVRPFTSNRRHLLLQRLPGV